MFDHSLSAMSFFLPQLDRACAQAGASSAGDDAVAGSSKAAAAAMEIAEAERVLRARSTGERPSASAASGLFSASDGEDERRQPVGATTVPGEGARARSCCFGSPKHTSKGLYSSVVIAVTECGPSGNDEC